MGNSELLMLVRSNVRITEEFSCFLVSHLMWLFGIPLKLEVFIKGLQGDGFRCAIDYYRYFSGELWLGVARSRSFIIAAWKRLTKGV